MEFSTQQISNKNLCVYTAFFLITTWMPRQVDEISYKKVAFLANVIIMVIFDGTHSFHSWMVFTLLILMMPHVILTAAVVMANMDMNLNYH